MAQFLSPLIVEDVNDSTFRLVEDLKYQSDIVKDVIVVPKGFDTDFASVPRIGMIYAMLGDLAHKPAVVHDWLYYTGQVSRRTADRVMLEAMEEIGVPLYRRWPIYWGVRTGGWVAWNGHRKNR